MEKILDYIEEHLTEAIDFDEIAKLACCSNYNFQRVFSFCMEIPLAEYIRNRRMSAAADEIRTSDIRILDLAVKYGYDSQEAFSRAFMKFHGATPKQARNAIVTLNVCPKATLMFKESSKPMNIQARSYFLEKKPTGERLKNKPPSPITLNFPVSMWSYMEYVGHNSNTMQTYTLLANLCGDTYNAGLALTEDYGIQFAVDQFGYKCKIYSTRQSDKNYCPEVELRERILNEIAGNKRPVIAVNVVDCCFGGAIVGYEDDGECLLNWGYFPFDFSDNPQPVLTKCRDWYGKTQKVIFIDEGSGSNIPVDLKQIYINGLKKASEYLGNAKRLKTEKFFLDWRNRLMENEPLINNDVSLIDPMWCDYAEKRFYAGQFMLQLKAFHPQYETTLNELWEIFGRKINSLMYEYIDKVDLTPGAGCESINKVKLNDETIRKEMCEIVTQCEEEERKAAELVRDIILEWNESDKRKSR
ncbi:helix-turn-helix domain-containing protein [Gorillibacterium massiliense]|uniref:helix-turn-helix domain-containing protein n=1 Tax=Gorillibacterium massiliense TaxID=1280390 RepID=UPI00138DE287|nr:AraC family transcriptional regulator [Gorillibacterium massiliense]